MRSAQASNAQKTADFEGKDHLRKVLIPGLVYLMCQLTGLQAILTSDEDPEGKRAFRGIAGPPLKEENPPRTLQV